MSISTFRKYLSEAPTSSAYFTFGRCNPPTAGHGKMFDKLSSTAGRNKYFVFLSQTQDPKKNPLSYSDKVKHVRKMFPSHARNVIVNRKVRTFLDAVSVLYDMNYRSITMVVGSDRVNEFETLLNKYNGVKSRHGFYNFETIDVISAGARDPDSSGVEGMSASRQRASASDNDFAAFSQGVPKAMSNKDTRKLFNDVRKGMGLKEEASFKHHIELDKVSDTREQYVRGDLYALGDRVLVKEDKSTGTINWLGTNYLIVDMDDGTKQRKWVDAVEHVSTAESLDESKEIPSNEKSKAILTKIQRVRLKGKSIHREI
jgi:hypothetical protein